MSFRQLQAVVKILEKERRRNLKDQLAVAALAARAEPEVLQKMLK